MESRGKEAAGHAAAALVEPGMVVGIGTGSTARFFIEALGKRCSTGLQVRGVATSQGSQKLAKEVGIPMVTIDEIDRIDLTVDGADEIDPQKRMVKGGGGALLREKIIATHSQEMVVVVDSSKCVDQLGAFGLPIEITPFGYTQTLRLIERLGKKAKLRTTQSGELVITDNRNYLVDLAFASPIRDPEQLQIDLLLIPGVVETGLFLTQAGRVFFGQPDGTVTIIGS